MRFKVSKINVQGVSFNFVANVCCKIDQTTKANRMSTTRLLYEVKVVNTSSNCLECGVINKICRCLINLQFHFPSDLLN